MDSIWRHRYSFLSLAICLGNSLVIYGALHGWFWAGPLIPPSRPYRHILVVHASDTMAAVAMAALAAAKERTRTLAIVAGVVAWLSFFFFGMSMAV